MVGTLKNVIVIGASVKPLKNSKQKRAEYIEWMQIIGATISVAFLLDIAAKAWMEQLG